MVSNTGAVEVFTPRPRHGQLALCEQLLTSFSSTDSSEAAPTSTPNNARQRTHVQFAPPQEMRKNVTTERLKVDEVDDNVAPLMEVPSSRRTRSRSCSVLRGATGPRSASRPARRRALSRGRPISRDTTSDQPDAPGTTPEEVARELRPESFTRFKRITLDKNKQPNKVVTDTSCTDTSCEQLETGLKDQINAVKKQLEETAFRASPSHVGHKHGHSTSTVSSQKAKRLENDNGTSHICAEKKETQA